MKKPKMRGINTAEQESKERICSYILLYIDNILCVLIAKREKTSYDFLLFKYKTIKFPHISDIKLSVQITTKFELN